MCDVTLLYISGVRKGALAGQEWHLHVQEVLIVASAAADFAFQLANEQYNNNDDHIVIIIIDMKWCVAMSSYVVLPLQGAFFVNKQLSLCFVIMNGFLFFLENC